MWVSIDNSYVVEITKAMVNIIIDNGVAQSITVTYWLQLHVHKMCKKYHLKG